MIGDDSLLKDVVIWGKTEGLGEQMQRGGCVELGVGAG